VANMDILYRQSLINNLIQKQKVVLFSVGGRGRGGLEMGECARVLRL